jgi:hypothetical protein
VERGGAAAGAGLRVDELISARRLLAVAVEAAADVERALVEVESMRAPSERDGFAGAEAAAEG